SNRGSGMATTATAASLGWAKIRVPRQLGVARAAEPVHDGGLVRASGRPAVEIGLEALVAPEAALGGAPDPRRGERGVHQGTAARIIPDPSPAERSGPVDSRRAGSA